jgi:hypothetical protein
MLIDEGTQEKSYARWHPADPGDSLPRLFPSEGATLKRLAGLLLAALALIAAVFLGAFGYARQQNGEDGAWFLLASGFGISLIIGLCHGRDGVPNWDPRTFFVIFAGGLIGLVLVAVQPEAVSVVGLGIVGVSLVTVRRRPMKLCAACAQRIRAEASKCRYCGEVQPALDSWKPHHPPQPKFPNQSKTTSRRL